MAPFLQILALLPALQILDNTRLIERKRKGPALVQPLTSFQASKVPGKEEIDAAAVAARAAERGIAVQGRKREWGVKRPAADGDEVEEEEGGEEEREARRVKRTRQAIEDARLAEAGASAEGATADDAAGKRRKRKPHSALESAADAPPAVKPRSTKKAAEEAAPAKPAEPEVKKRKRKPHSAPAAAAPAKDAKWREKQAAKPVVATPAETPAAAAPAADATESEGAEKPKRKRKPRGASPPPDEAGAVPPKAAEKTSVLKVVEVKPARRDKKAGKAASGGLNLEQAFKQPAASAETADVGGGAFGTGGWDD